MILNGDREDLVFEDGLEWPISVCLREKDWRLVSECLRIARDSGILCDKHLDYLFMIHEEISNQMIDKLEKILEKFKEN